MSRRFRKDWKPWTAANAAHNVRLHPERLDIPMHWKKPRQVFVCSMGDLFHKQVPDRFIEQVFEVMVQRDRHTYQVLTKRAERMCHWVVDHGRRIGFPMAAYAPNIQLGVTIESPKYIERIEWLLQTPAAVRFVSCEPLLEAVDLRRYLRVLDDEYPEEGVIGGLDQIIVGGESGPKARPMNPAWPRSIRDQCQAAGVPFFFKQHGEFVGDDDISVSALANYKGLFRDFPDNVTIYRVGKKAAGRELDGRTWEEMPE